MRERGMIFNAEMVRAILNGSKTQTRRIVKSQYQHESQQLVKCEDGLFRWWIRGAQIPHGGPVNQKYGKVGDRIWVRETWAEAGAGAPELTLYRANYPEHVPSHYENITPVSDIRWTPSIHMPRWASRILLEITAVRVERLNAISDKDAQAEGLERYNDDGIVYYGPYGRGDCRPERAFSELWQSIYGESSWQANPWVWVIEFKRVEARNV